ncbi:MAG: acyl carrier protein [Clostridiaceae bacterium]
MILERVQAVLAKELSLNAGDILLESNFEDLGIDSLDLVELIMQLEDEFDIAIDEAEKLKTVNDVVEYISSKVSE